MSFTFTCEACGQKLEAEDEFAGKQANCPACGKEIIVPTLQEQAEREANKINWLDKKPEWMQGVLDDDHHIVAALLALFFGCLGGPYFYSENRQRTGVILLIVSLASFGLGAMLLSPLNVVLAIYFACMRNDDFLLKYMPSVLRRRTKAKQTLLEWYSGKPLPTVEPPDLPSADEK